MENAKEVYIVGGPNGAGKTTFVNKYFPDYLDIRNFVNADHIAFGLSPFDSSRMQIRAGKLMLDLIDSLMQNEESFGFETTLAGKRWSKSIRMLKDNGYTVHVFFLNIINIDLCIKRVKNRVKAGGHDIPEDVIIRRYKRSKENFWNIYKDVANYWYLFDNSFDQANFIASYGGIEDNEYLEKFLGEM